MRNNTTVITLMFILLITANAQMFIADDTNPLKYFGFIPLILCWIVMTINNLVDVLED
jgi:hypothetical protein